MELASVPHNEIPQDLLSLGTEGPLLRDSFRLCVVAVSSVQLLEGCEGSLSLSLSLSKTLSCCFWTNEFSNALTSHVKVW